MVDVEYLTVDEAAQTLRCVKRDKIYLLVRSGIIKGFKFGRRWLIDKHLMETLTQKITSGSQLIRL